MNSKMWVHIRAQNTFLLKKNKKTNKIYKHSFKVSGAYSVILIIKKSIKVLFYFFPLIFICFCHL